MCVRMCARVCMCVCEREREGGGRIETAFLATNSRPVSKKHTLETINVKSQKCPAAVATATEKLKWLNTEPLFSLLQKGERRTNFSHTELRSCVKVEVAVLVFPSLIVFMVSACGRKIKCLQLASTRSETGGGHTSTYKERSSRQRTKVSPSCVWPYGFGCMHESGSVDQGHAEAFRDTNFVHNVCFVWAF